MMNVSTSRSRLSALLLLSLIALTSCRKEPPVETPIPSLQATPIEAVADAITFKVSSTAVERVAYIVQLATSDTIPPSEEKIIAEGKPIEANKEVTIREGNLQTESDYIVYIVAHAPKGQIITTQLKMRTSQTGQSQIRLDRVLTAYYAIEDDQTANYVMNLSNADPNQAGNPINPGDVQIVLSLYNVKDPIPKAPSLPIGIYTLGDKGQYEIESSQSAFYFVNDDGSNSALPFASGSVEVQKSDDTYQITINLTDLSGNPIWAYYEGEIDFPLAGGASFDPFDTPQQVAFTSALGRYYGNWFAPHSDNFHIDFYAGEMSRGQLISGYELSLDGFMNKVADYNDPNIRIEAGTYKVDPRQVNPFDCLPMTIKHGELVSFLGSDIMGGTYLKYIDPETGAGKVGYITSGTMIVEDLGENYHISFDFTTLEGQTIKASFDRPISVGNFNDNDQTMPKKPWSVLKEDHQITFPKDATLIAYYMGNYLDPNFNSWMLVLASEQGGEMITTELVTPLAAGKQLVSNTYKIGWGVAPFKAFPGAMTYGTYDFVYSWFGDTSKVDDDGNSLFFAPLNEGAIQIQQEGDKYAISVQAKDDAGYNISGTWIGPANIQDFSQSMSRAQALRLNKLLKTP